MITISIVSNDAPMADAIRDFNFTPESIKTFAAECGRQVDFGSQEDATEVYVTTDSSYFKSERERPYRRATLLRERGTLVYEKMFAGWAAYVEANEQKFRLTHPIRWDAHLLYSYLKKYILHTDL